MPTFCRHNRFFADCPICSKGTVLDPNRQSQRRSRPSAAGRSGAKRRASATSAGARIARGPFVSVGPYGGAEVRLERVPGGLRMATWRGGQIERVAPVVDAVDVGRLLTEAAEKELLLAAAVSALVADAADKDPPTDAADNGERADAGDERPPAHEHSGAVAAAAQPGSYGASPGRTGELRDELRVERLDGDRVRVARWIMRPNRGWELQEAPVMLPPQRFAAALADAARKGVLASHREALASDGPVE